MDDNQTKMLSKSLVWKEQHWPISGMEKVDTLDIPTRIGSTGLTAFRTKN
jgi:hypothetical protein